MRPTTDSTDPSSFPVEETGLAKKVPIKVAVAGGGLLVVIGLAALVWHIYESNRKASEVPQINTLAPPGSAQPEGDAATVPRAPKRPPSPPPAEASRPRPQTGQLVAFQTLAREAYIKRKYVEPPEASAIAFSKRALEINPADDYSRQLLENSVKGVRYQVQQAIRRKDFAGARRLAEGLGQLLPGRKEVATLKRDIAAAEGAASHRAQPRAAPAASFRLYHMHSNKAPTERGPYCLGALSAGSGRLKFAPESASDGKVHRLDLACSEIKEIKKNSRVAARQGGFHVRTNSENLNFALPDPSVAVIPALNAACAK